MDPTRCNLGLIQIVPLLVDATAPRCYVELRLLHTSRCRGKCSGGTVTPRRGTRHEAQLLRLGFFVVLARRGWKLEPPKYPETPLRAEPMNPSAHDVIEFLVLQAGAFAAIFIVWRTYIEVRKYRLKKRFYDEAVRELLTPGTPASAVNIEALLMIAKEDGREALAQSKLDQVRQRFGHEGVTTGHIRWVLACMDGRESVDSDPPDYRTAPAGGAPSAQLMA